MKITNKNCFMCAAAFFSVVVVVAFLVLCFATVFSSCTMNGSSEDSRASIKVVNWNVQTFFDANNDGIEYSDFQRSKKWGIEAYTERLKKLCDAIKTLDGDVVILEEIENEGIIYDISNQLAGANWNPKKVYRYGCFSKTPNTSIGCAVLSRYELCGLKIHSLDVALQNGKMPSMRPLMEVDLQVCERGLKIFVNHWKSKSGGEEESRIWRRWQEGVLAQKIAETEIEKGDGNPAIICAGDFNQDISEFNLRESDNAEGNTPNVEFELLCSDEKVLVYSPWLDFEGEDGSYYFRDGWERIDHFFTCGDVVLKEFAPQSSGAWAYDDGRPKPFKIYSLNGWSDHLPIVCTVEF